MEIHYRKATLDDLQSIVNIYNEIIEEGGYTADLDCYSVSQKVEWFEQISQFPYNVFVAYVDNNIVGYFYLSPWRKGRRGLDKVAEITYYLKNEFRGYGIGKEMIRRCIDEATGNGLHHLIAVLLDENVRSRNLLEKFNFKIVGHLPNVANLRNQTCGQWIMQFDI